MSLQPKAINPRDLASGYLGFGRVVQRPAAAAPYGTTPVPFAAPQISPPAMSALSMLTGSGLPIPAAPKQNMGFQDFWSNPTQANLASFMQTFGNEMGLAPVMAQRAQVQQPAQPQIQAPSPAPMSFMPANPLTTVPFAGQDMNALAALLAQNKTIAPQDYFGSMSINPRYQNYLG